MHIYNQGTGTTTLLEVFTLHGSNSFRNPTRKKHAKFMQNCIWLVLIFQIPQQSEGRLRGPNDEIISTLFILSY